MRLIAGVAKQHGDRSIGGSGEEEVWMVRFRMLNGSGDSEKLFDHASAVKEATRLLGGGFLGFDVPGRKQIRSPEDIKPDGDVIWSGVLPVIG